VFYERFNPYFINENLKRISELCEVKGGKRVPKGEQFSVEKTSRPYLRVTDMTNKSINKEDLRFLSEGIFYLIKNYTISKDDVYISIAGTIGAVGTIPKDLDGASLTENAAKLVIKNKRELDKIYLSYVFEHNLIKNQIKKRICAVGVPKLAIFRIEDIQIPLPPLPLQQKFAKIVEKVEKLKEKQKESKEKIDEMFNSLMSKAFKGELA
jgi:type I restriction enzyme S subunit